MQLTKKILPSPSVFITEIVAQLVRASDCGSEGRGFDPRHPPKINNKKCPEIWDTFFIIFNLVFVYLFIVL